MQNFARGAFINADVASDAPRKQKDEKVKRYLELQAGMMQQVAAKSYQQARLMMGLE